MFKIKGIIDWVMFSWDSYSRNFREYWGGGGNRKIVNIRVLGNLLWDGVF